MRPIIYNGETYQPIENAYINQDGNAEMRAIRIGDSPDELGAVDLYRLRYVLMEPEDYENGPDWWDNVDWDEPDGLDRLPYGWIISEGRIC